MRLGGIWGVWRGRGCWLDDGDGPVNINEGLMIDDGTFKFQWRAWLIEGLVVFDGCGVMNTLGKCQCRTYCESLSSLRGIDSFAIANQLASAHQLSLSVLFNSLICKRRVLMDIQVQRSDSN